MATEHARVHSFVKTIHL